MKVQLKHEVQVEKNTQTRDERHERNLKGEVGIDDWLTCNDHHKSDHGHQTDYKAHTVEGLREDKRGHVNEDGGQQSCEDACKATKSDVTFVKTLANSLKMVTLQLAILEERTFASLLLCRLKMSTKPL